MEYANPQRLHVRAKAVNAALSGDPERLVPAIATELRDEIAAARKVTDYGDGTFLWYVQFHWPTTQARQSAIAGRLKALDAKTAWLKQADLPDAVQAAAAKVKFVGEVAMPTKAPVAEAAEVQGKSLR